MTDEIQGPPAEMPPPSGIKVRKAAFGFVMITVLLDVMGLGLVIPVWPALITSFTGSMANAGWWVGDSAITKPKAALRTLIPDGGGISAGGPWISSVIGQFPVRPIARPRRWFSGGPYTRMEANVNYYPV